MMRFHNRWFLNIPHTTTQPSVAHYHHMFHPTLLRHWKGIEIHLLKQSPCLVKFLDNAASFVIILQQSKYLGICLSFVCWGRLLSVGSYQIIFENYTGCVRWVYFFIFLCISREFKNITHSARDYKWNLFQVQQNYIFWHGEIFLNCKYLIK